MPYRVKGSTVQVKRGTRWVVLKRHPSAAKAQAHLRALNANVPHGTRRSRRGTKK